MTVYEMAKSNLAELLAELTLEYGMSPKWSRSPNVTLMVIDKKTTEPAARQRMLRFLTRHELQPLSVVVSPGAEVAMKFNRSVTVTLPRDEVIPRGNWLQ